MSDATKQSVSSREHTPVRAFTSFEEAGRLDEADIAAMTPAERMEMVFVLTERVWKTHKGYRDDQRLPRHTWPVEMFRC